MNLTPMMSKNDPCQIKLDNDVTPTDQLVIIGMSSGRITVVNGNVDR